MIFKYIKSLLERRRGYIKYKAIPLCKKRELHYMQSNAEVFSKSGTRNTLRVKLNYLQNFTSNFGCLLDVYIDFSSPFKKYKIYKILSRKRCKEIIDSFKTRNVSDYVNIIEILKLYEGLDLKEDFLAYFLSKTSTSFSIFPEQPIFPIEFIDVAKSSREALYTKFSEFIHVILVEYMLIHNLMAISKFKLKQINSIDSFLKDIGK